MYAIIVVVPYYLSQGYNQRIIQKRIQNVVVPYYLSQGYNFKQPYVSVAQVVVPYYLSQGYNEYEEEERQNGL